MKTKDEIIFEKIGVPINSSNTAPMDKGECIICMEAWEQALKEKLTKKIEASKLSGLSKATVYALITQL